MKILKLLFLLGSALILIGSFSPWFAEGDAISYVTRGLSISPVFNDNGGLVVVLLCLIVLLLVFRPIEFFERPSIWKIIFSSVLVLISLAHILKIFYVKAIFEKSIGPVVSFNIGYGLIMVLLGCLILFLASGMDYVMDRKKKMMPINVP